MIFSPELLVAGMFLLGFALRSFGHPSLHRAGMLVFIAGSFAGGWLFTGLWPVGAVCASAWLLTPWIELLGRVRHLRMPMEKKLEFRHAPSSERFPMLGDLSAELEDEGFTHIEDAGWEWAESRHFLRIFEHREQRLMASLCLVEQEDFGFYFVGISAMERNGTIWTTWNYPFPMTLKVPPSMKLARVSPDASIFQLVTTHQSRLSDALVETGELEPVDPDRVNERVEAELRLQIDYNLKAGLLLEAGDGMIRYSWRGMLFLWCQFLRDLVRFTH